MLANDLSSLSRQVAILEAAMVELGAPPILVTLAEEICQTAAALSVRAGGESPELHCVLGEAGVMAAGPSASMLTGA